MSSSTKSASHKSMSKSPSKSISKSKSPSAAKSSRTSKKKLSPALVLRNQISRKYGAYIPKTGTAAYAEVRKQYDDMQGKLGYGGACVWNDAVKAAGYGLAAKGSATYKLIDAEWRDQLQKQGIQVKAAAKPRAKKPTRHCAKSPKATKKSSMK